MPARFSTLQARLLPHGPLDAARQVVLFVGALQLYSLTRGLVNDPDAATTAMLLVALGLLAESFGRSVWRLWVLAGRPPGARATVTSALALLLVWAALLVPDRVDDLSPSAFLRIPVEGLFFVVLVLVLPPGVARILALVGGLGLGALTVLRLLDMGFHFAFDRPFHPLYDTAYAGSAVGLLGDMAALVDAAGKVVPGLGAAATQEGVATARNGECRRRGERAARRHRHGGAGGDREEADAASTGDAAGDPQWSQAASGCGFMTPSLAR